MAGTRWGVDVDGVLADFNRAYVALYRRLFDKDLFPKGEVDLEWQIPCWYYPEHFGYTKAQGSEVWKEIKASQTYWFNLSGYPNLIESMQTLGSIMMLNKDDVYFVTARPGTASKRQTEYWLSVAFQMACPQWQGQIPVTVLITEHKGLAARTLDLDHYIDDKTTNCIEVAQTKTKVYCQNRTWNAEGSVDGFNAEENGVIRVNSVREMVEHVYGKGVEAPLPGKNRVTLT